MVNRVLRDCRVGLLSGFAGARRSLLNGSKAWRDMTATVAKWFAHSGHMGQRKGIIVVPLNSRAVTLGTSHFSRTGSCIKNRVYYLSIHTCAVLADQVTQTLALHSFNQLNNVDLIPRAFTRATFAHTTGDTMPEPLRIRLRPDWDAALTYDSLTRNQKTGLSLSGAKS